MSVALATRTHRLAHRVTARHACSQAPITGLRAHLDPVPRGWVVRVRGADVLVITQDPAGTPAAAPALVLTVVDPRTAGVLSAPSARIPLTAAQITHDFVPVPMPLELVLVRTGTGEPRTGAAVTARATSGATPRPTIALPEVAPGVYRSAAVVWTSAFHPLDLLVGPRVLRRVTLDLTQTLTRVHLVDTT